MLDSLPRTAPAPARASRPSLLQRLHEKRRLAKADRLGARLARLDAVDDLLARVHTRIEAGWTQDAWFVTRDPQGERYHVGVLRAREGEGSERACLVAAVAVEALPGAVNGPVAQRALGAMWDVLHGGGAAVDWTAPPGVAAARARDLVRWNDARDRRQSDVLALVGASRDAVDRNAARLRGDLATT